MSTMATNKNVLIKFLNLFLVSVKGDFLIDGANCKIANLNPFSKDAMKIFKRGKYEACSSIRPLTSIENIIGDEFNLVLHKERKNDYLSWWQKDIKVNIFKNCIFQFRNS